ncbi:hypothetical protein ABZ953_30445 [Streptomyces sp. NPDC046465]|uniref:hypothetical protein n=1 Tax=Streptomyces sp. NPDC046465 TaxID=3155810 RepID=UPI0034036235
MEIFANRQTGTASPPVLLREAIVQAVSRPRDRGRLVLDLSALNSCANGREALITRP